MDKSLPANILRQSVGNSVTSFHGKILGDIVEIIYSDTKEQPEYIIIKSSLLEGNTDRFFAIPAFTTLVTVTEKGAIVLKAGKKDLSLAKRIRASQCPPANIDFNPPIYELYQYEESANKKENPNKNHR